MMTNSLPTMIPILILHFLFLTDFISAIRPLFECNSTSGECLALLRPKFQRNLDNSEQQQNYQGEDLELCSLNCESNGALWPRPTGEVKLGLTKVPIDINNIWLSELTWHSDILDIFDVFLNKLIQFLPHDFDRTVKSRGIAYLSVTLSVNGTKNYIDSLEIDESYELNIADCQERDLQKNPIQVEITGNSIQGVRHGLESFLQLIAYSELHSALYILCDCKIKDAPVYPYRGISLDVARRFYPIASLERLIDGMSHSKLNYLHLHLTDSQSFSFESITQPEMTYYGSYGKDKVYTQANMKKLEKYARLRGVTIIPEIDAPSHVGAGWNSDEGSENPMMLCYPGLTQLGPPWGTLNPLNPKIYEVIQNLFTELIEIFGRPNQNNLVHIGGDEVWMGCWKNSKLVMDWIHKQQKVYQNGNTTAPTELIFLSGLWENFEGNVLKSVQIANKNRPTKSIIWSSHLTKSDNFPKNLDVHPEGGIIVQDWSVFNVRDIQKLMDKGVDVILSPSNYWYFDCGVGSWVGTGNSWCGVYHDWKHVYAMNITSVHEHKTTTDSAKSGKLLGGEACVWSESISSNDLEAKVWPRGAALAERLWSNPESNWRDAHLRLISHRNRLWKMGIHAESLQPEWCDNNGRKCLNGAH